MTEHDIRQSLIDQLRQQDKETPYTLGLVDEYMWHYEVVQGLQADVKKRGVKVTGMNTKGFEVVKDNESLKAIRDEHIAMLKILQTLKLQEPVKLSNNHDYL